MASMFLLTGILKILMYNTSQKIFTGFLTSLVKDIKISLCLSGWEWVDPELAIFLLKMPLLY